MSKTGWWQITALSQQRLDTSDGLSVTFLNVPTTWVSLLEMSNFFFLNVGKEALLQCKGFAEVKKCDRSSQDVCVGFDFIYLWIGPEARVNRWQMVSPGPQWKGKSTLTIVLCSQVPRSPRLGKWNNKVKEKAVGREPCSSGHSGRMCWRGWGTATTWCHRVCP